MKKKAQRACGSVDLCDFSAAIKTNRYENHRIITTHERRSVDAPLVDIHHHAPIRDFPQAPLRGKMTGYEITVACTILFADRGMARLETSQLPLNST
jgi:hypothetical protein